MNDLATNVLGGILESCSLDPLTGFLRTGCCQVTDEDVGNHGICALMSDEFLSFSKRMGNDLSTPRPAYGFAGLKAGDRWCLCAARWQEALENRCAPQVVLSATSSAVLEIVRLDDLKKHAAVEPTHPREDKP
jgi:uncharacterized protein (DUF2237 family)